MNPVPTGRFAYQTQIDRTLPYCKPALAAEQTFHSWKVLAILDEEAFRPLQVLARADEEVFQPCQAQACLPLRDDVEQAPSVRWARCRQLVYPEHPGYARHKRRCLGPKMAHT